MESEMKIEIDPQVDSKEVQVLAMVLGEKLQLLSPAGSRVVLLLRPGDSFCEIKSRRSHFTCRSGESDPQVALSEIDHKMMLQITHWKSHRFSAKNLMNSVNP